MIRMFLVIAASFLLTQSNAFADVITSTATGGQWHDSGTWMGGVVPDGNDDVTVQGPVVVQGSAACLTLDVTATGSLTSGNAPSTLIAGGAITNAGTIADGPLPFRVEIGGDLTNDALWTNQQTIFMGAASHHLVAGGESTFESKLAVVPAVTGDVIVETPFAILGDIDMRGGRMRLQPNCPLTMRQGALSGEVLCNGNEIRFESWSYMDGAALDQAVLVGEVEVTHADFTGGLTVMDVLQNLRSAGNGSVSIEGGLVNHGLIRNDHYGFHVDLAGDLTCHGVINCPMLALDENTIHHLTMGPEGDLQVLVLLPEFVPGTIVVDSDVRFSDGVALGIDGTMILSPGASVHLADFGSLSGGTVLAGGNTILMDGVGALTGTTIDNAVLQGTVQVSNNCNFTNGVAIQGTLQSAAFFSPELNVTGQLLNMGLIQNGPMSFKIRAHGDIVNQGVWTNARLVVDGAEDQAIEVGGGIAVPEVVFESNLQASAYQWFRDGVPIPGATSPTLAFATLGAGDNGSYRCEGDGVPSRSIMVTGNAAGVPGPSEAPIATMLGAARPNPFRSSTIIDFALDGPAPVRLSAFDVAGRLVAVLIDERRSAGRHAVPWRADDLAPGVYFLRLEAGPTHAVRKLIRLE